MIEISEKMRRGIALSIDSISLEEANTIAGEQCVGPDTVYRYIRQIKHGKRLFRNEHVITALANLAIQKKKVASLQHQQAKEFEKQLSEIK